MQGISPVIHKHLDNLPEGEVIDLNQTFNRMSFEVIITAMIGEEFLAHYETLHQGLNLIARYLTNANYFPELIRSLDPDYRRYRHYSRELDRIIYHAIDRKEEGKEKSAGVTDMIQLLKKAQYSDGSSIDRQELRDQVLTLMFAGYDTTALTLSWLSYELSRHQDIQEKMREELSTLKPHEATDFTKLNQLKYTDSVLKEAMRLHPPGWGWTRFPQEADNVNGASVTPDQVVLLCPYLTHRDERYFAGPEVFRPERFTPENEKKIPLGAYMPFGSGPRTCIGKMFSLYEMKMALHRLYTNYRVHPTKQIPERSPEITIGCKGGVQVKLEKL